MLFLFYVFIGLLERHTIIWPKKVSPMSYMGPLHDGTRILEGPLLETVRTLNRSIILRLEISEKILFTQKLVSRDLPSSVSVVNFEQVVAGWVLTTGFISCHWCFSISSESICFSDVFWRCKK